VGLQTILTSRIFGSFKMKKFFISFGGGPLRLTEREKGGGRKGRMEDWGEGISRIIHPYRRNTLTFNTLLWTVISSANFCY